MLRVTQHMKQIAARIAQTDRRCKVSVLFVIIVFIVLIRSTFVVVNFPLLLWFGKDTCEVWRGRGLSLWKAPAQAQWWHKLCMLETEMEVIDYECRDKRWMGNRLVCFDSKLIPKDNCIVYSFGIAFDFAFDDAMAEVGCTVYSFDPSMNNVSEHKHGERVFFMRTGLHGSDDDHFKPRFDGYVSKPTTWRMRRLATIMKELGHARGSVAMVKIDIESYEWNVMEDLLRTEGLLAAIPQFLIEWHLFRDNPPRSRYDDLVSIYNQFKNTGFKKFYSGNEGTNHFIGLLQTQRETSYVNTRFLQQS